MSLGFFFSTARKGYLYDMHNNPKNLCEYDFTEDCVSACLTNKMLYVITRSGLETYTTRLFPAAAQAASNMMREDMTLSPHNQNEDKHRDRTWSSLSFSSGSEVDAKSQAGDSLHEFDSEVSVENQGSDDIIPTDGHYTKVLPEPRSNTPKKTKSRLSLRRRKKQDKSKRDSRSSHEQEKREEDFSELEKSGGFKVTDENIHNQTRYDCHDLLKVRCMML